MTTYGTIPASSSASVANLEYLSRAKERIEQGLGARRPWKLMFNIHSINFPRSLSDSITRFKTNVAYFRMNYAIVVLVILFLSLLWHPISLIVLVIMMALWLFFYFQRDKPLIVFNRTIDDRVVLVVLAVSTFVFLLLTDATSNILVSVLVVVVVSVHASLRKIDDLFDEESTDLINGASSSSS